MIKVKSFKKLKHKRYKYKKKIFINKKKKLFFYKLFFTKLLNILTLCGNRAKAYQLYQKLFCKFFNSTKLSFFFCLCLFCKKEKIPFRLIGIRRRGKVVGIPVPISYISQVSDIFRKLAFFSKKFNRGAFNYLSSFFIENYKMSNKDIFNYKMNTYKIASSTARQSTFKVSRYRW